MSKMCRFRTEFVGKAEDKNVPMPKQETVRKILEGLWMICSARESGDGFEWYPEGEFCFRKRNEYDRIFRVRIFEGREDANRERSESDGGPGRGGLDALGKYSLGDSTITIYLDSCRKAESEYNDGSWKLENLIKVVLIHELAHLITDKRFDLEKLGNENEHVWEYTAQCATYAYLKIYGKPEDLEIFERLSAHQPFIYRTWEGLKAIESVHSKNLITVVVKCVFDTLNFPVPEIENMHEPQFDPYNYNA